MILESDLQMEANGNIENTVSTNVRGHHNTVNNTIHITINMDRIGAMRQTEPSTQTSNPFGGTSLQGSYNTSNIQELITDKTKRNAEVKELEIAWLADEVANSGLLCHKKDSLYRWLGIPNQECMRIKQERLGGNRNIEDEIFKVVCLGWLQKPPTKTRNGLIKHLLKFSETFAKNYADYINNCDNFDIGLPLSQRVAPTTRTIITSLPPSLPSEQEPPSLPAPAAEIAAQALSSLSIHEPNAADRGQLVQPSTQPVHQGASEVDGQALQSSCLYRHLCAEVTEDEITWLSGKVTSGRHFSERNRLYRHLIIPDSEVEKIKYERLDEDRSIENEIFKVIYYGWYLQGERRMRALLFRQLLTFNISLAEDFIKYHVENLSCGR